MSVRVPALTCETPHDRWTVTRARSTLLVFFFFFKDTATPEISPLSLHDALPISKPGLNQKLYERTSLLQYATFQFFAITVLAGLPAKMILRLVFRVHYVLITPWFNI